MCNHLQSSQLSVTHCSKECTFIPYCSPSPEEVRLSNPANNQLPARSNCVPTAIEIPATVGLCFLHLFYSTNPILPCQGLLSVRIRIIPMLTTTIFLVHSWSGHGGTLWVLVLGVFTVPPCFTVRRGPSTLVPDIDRRQKCAGFCLGKIKPLN